MSLGMFFAEFKDILSQIEFERRTAASTGYFKEDAGRIWREYKELLEDASDFASSYESGGLANKLRALYPEEDKYGYGTPDLEDIEIRVRRVLRILRTFGNVSEFTAEPVSVDETIAPSPSVSSSRRVFIVHGHDDAATLEVETLVLRLGLVPVVLRKEPNRGRTIIEKFEGESSAAFAVILFTADDMGGSLKEAQDRNLKPRARQNAILELGYFVAKIGRERVVVLRDPDVEIPSDFHGVIYHAIDSGGAWKTALAREMKSAGLAVDLNEAF